MAKNNGLKFTKMSGNGNDFILMDNYDGKIKLSAKQIEALCSPKFSIGADGLILLEKGPKGHDFYMKFYNNDGKEAEMCGNGGRCIARFAFLNGRARAKLSFMAKDGAHEAEIKKNGEVKLRMIDPFDYKKEVKIRLSGSEVKGAFINTGVPHFVIEVKDLAAVRVKHTGKEIRFHNSFAPKGTNVNFIEKKADDAYDIRTYERGVEDETYACGTGATAAGIALYLSGKANSPVSFNTKGGLLKVYFEEVNKKITNVHLEGNARVVASGEVGEDAFKF